MSEPFADFVARRWDNTQPGGLNVAQTIRDVQVNQLDKLDGGSRPAVILGIATEPTATDTVTIGADVYEFVATAGAVADDANIAVELTGVVATTVDNLIAAINATTAGNEHDNITNVATDAPALANGTEFVVADKTLGAALIRVRAAQGPGGAVTTDLSTVPSLVLAETLTAAADLWQGGSVNVNTLGALASQQLAQGRIKYTAANVVAGGKRVFSFPFTVIDFLVQVRTAAGIVKYPIADAWTLSGSDVVLTLNGGGAPEVVNTDVVTVLAWG